MAARWVPAGGTVGAVLVGMLRWRLRRFTPMSRAFVTIACALVCHRRLTKISK
jgi:hypothetical protein